MALERFRVGFGFGVVVLLVLVGSACGGSSEPDDALSDPSTTATAATTATTGTSAATATTVVRPETDGLVVLWADLIAAGALPVDERADAIGALGDGVTAEVGAAVAGLVGDGEAGEVSTYPVLTRETATRFEIVDCVLYQPQVLGAVNHVLVGTGEVSDSGSWTITEVERRGTGCVPAAIAEPALQAYNDYIEASVVFANPADPDHPALDRYLVDDMRELIRGRLIEFQDQGIVGQFEDGEMFAEVSDVFAPDWIGLRACFDPAPDAGRYDADGNKLTNNGEPIPDDYRDLAEVEMVLEEEQWKMRKADFFESAPCELEPSPAGLRVVGEP